MEKQKLREGLNQFTITGVLKENNLEVRDDLRDKKTNELYTAIRGDLVVKVGDHDEHTIEFFAKQFTKTGAENKLFKAYKTVMETYTSMADIAGLPEHEKEGLYPTRLTVQGDIGINDYYGNNGLVKFTKLNGKFVNSVKDEEVEDCAEFDIEVYINKMKPELDKDGIETGRLNVEGISVGYNGIVSPIDFKVTNEFGVANYMSSTFQVGDTVSLWGNIINSAIEKTKTKQGFGQTKEETTTTYKKEILITGGEEFPLQDGKEFNSQLIQTALQERENYLIEVETEGKKKQAAPRRAASGFGNQPSRPTPPERRTPDEIPF